MASIYAPNRNPERNDFLDFCIDNIDPSIPTVVCGDFNTVMERALDRRGSDSLDSSRESSSNLNALFLSAVFWIFGVLSILTLWPLPG